ncbi:MAG: aminotransferase class I/II-fold pyridoxal phosphate-dependent enzyme [Clostridia bacterium]|nr:aminotransferase class I/II-fold pyridoxal phosphate-dependent enzyme [Clostridia bacterium]
MKKEFFTFDERIKEASKKALAKASVMFNEIEEITEYTQQKVLAAFINNNVCEADFSGTTGYGYGDRGREKLDRIYAEAFGAEDAIVRHTFTCGTHTLAVALFGILRPGDTMLCVTGTPYDTIHSVIGLSGEGMGSLKEFGVSYAQVDLKTDGKPDLEAIEKAVKSNPKMVYIQRSRGYSLRPSLSVDEIGEIVDIVKKNSDAVVMVDNCYGEFVETREPTEVGADIIAGSLIKNAGGALARTGGYIAGKKELVELCAYRATTPGLGKEVGCSLDENRNMFMGVFNAPNVVGSALKAAVFAAAMFEDFGFDVTPASNESRHDIIQALCLKTPERLVAFCQGIQSGAPVDAYVVPEPWDMPGYDSKVIMAAGAFIMGSSIELSADAPLREPFAVWLQGGINFSSAKTAIMLAAQKLLKEGLI